MDFRIGKNELLRGLYLTHGIADRKNTIPILANVLVRASGKDKVVFAATDLKVAMIVNSSAKVSEEGGITVGARQLYEIVKGLGGDEVRLQRTEQNWLHIESGRTEFKVVGMSDRDLHSFPTRRSSDLLEPPSPARASNHARKLALRAGPADTSLRLSPSDWQDLAPVAPPSAAADWPASATSTAPGPASERTPASNTPAPIMPDATTASPRSGALVKTPAGDSLSEERLLAAAIRALRAKTDPPSALAALDEYRTHYPHGRLFVEAEVLRVDTLTALKNTSEALRVLDGLDFAQMPGGLARQLQRAELRAAAGRYREAEADFANVLVRARSQDLDVLEQALWGRAQSRAGLGDADGARTDADEYVRRFPTGRFATAAARIGSSTSP